MYQAHFNLSQEPFSIAPDPSFLYLSTAHAEALAHLMYGLSHGGFVLITGEVGTGKTTLLRNLLKQTPPDLDVAFVLNPRLTVRELLETLCDELGISYDPEASQSIKQFIDALNAHLLNTHRSGRSTVVIIDEAQNLSPAVLEQIRLLTNLETDERKLLRIILVGQPELNELLGRQELRQLAQRITARYHLGALNREDSYAYVVHRLGRVGGHPQTFTGGALRRLYGLSRGIPRVINVIADRALLGAYVEGKQQVSAGILSRAASEVLGKRPRKRLWLGAGLVAIGLVGIAAAYLAPETSPGPAGGQDAVADNVVADGEVIAESTEAGGTRDAKPEQDDNDAARHAAPPPASPSGTPIPPTTRPAAVATIVNAARSPAESISITPAEEKSVVRRPGGNTFSTRRQAYVAIFTRWGAQFSAAPGNQIPCDFAPSAGLQCLSQRGTWSDIEQVNLPVVLELWDDQPTPFYAALTSIQDDTLTLTLGKQQLDVEQRDLRDSWYGSYVVLWQTPPGYRGSIRQGDSHETVSWLRQQIGADSSASPSTANPDFFDANLHSAVVEFQRREGLVMDGVVGPATWIRLASQLQLPAPNLRT